MDESKRKTMLEKVERTLDSLRKNRMDADFVESAGGVAGFVEKLLRPGDTVTVGGSVTLRETGVLDLLKNGNYRYLDRYRPGLNEEQLRKIFIGAFSADVYLTSSNAVTEQGELYNVDGRSNRTAALLYGPRRVIVVAGWNKLVPDLAAARERVRNLAAPANAVRLGLKTPCARTGRCMDCASPERMCCNTVVCGPQRVPGRIRVVLVGESLGY